MDKFPLGCFHFFWEWIFRFFLQISSNEKWMMTSSGESYCTFLFWWVQNGNRPCFTRRFLTMLYGSIMTVLFYSVSERFWKFIDMLSSKPPEDKYNAVYFILLLHGIGVLMPWNMFITIAPSVSLNSNMYFKTIISLSVFSLQKIGRGFKQNSYCYCSCWLNCEFRDFYFWIQSIVWNRERKVCMLFFDTAFLITDVFASVISYACNRVLVTNDLNIK